MKQIKNFFVFAFVLALATLVSCEMMIPPFIGPTDRPDNGEVDTDTTQIVIDTVGWNIPAEAITVSQAREICAQLESGATTGQKYYVMGFVKKLHNKHAEGISGYGNAQFYIVDEYGSNSSEDFMAYQVYGPNSQQISDPNAVAVGDFVVLYGELTNYNGTYETVGRGAAYIWNSTNPLLTDNTDPDEPQEPEELIIPEEAKSWNIPAEAIDVLQAREICSKLASGATTGTKYYVMGYVKKLHNKHAEGVSGYGNAQFYMENVKGRNSQNDFMAYQVFGLNGEKISDPNVVVEGDFVVVYGELTNYMGTYETVGKGAAYIWKSTNPLMVEAKPEPKEVEILNETLATTSSLGNFGIANILGTNTWAYNRRAKCAEINGAGEANEDWLITPQIDLAGMSEATLSFSYKFGAAIPEGESAQYTVWISKNYDGNVENVNKATWVELKGFPYDATTFSESGNISLPTEMIGEKCHIAWKYTSTTTAGTSWMVRNIVVKAMTKVD